jgi:regulator of sigma E protease
MQFIISFLVDLIAFLITVAMVTVIHELGHYLVAIWYRVQVEEFSIGYGKELVAWQDRKNTRWKICWLPLGGFCKFFGDEDASSTIVSSDKSWTTADRQKSLSGKTPGQRLQIAAAGPLFNYLLAVVLFTVFYLLRGVERIPNVIDFVIPGSVAADIDLQSGDRLMAINDRPIVDFTEIQRNVLLNVGEPLLLKVERAGQILWKVAIPRPETGIDVFGKETKSPVLGVGNRSHYRERIGFFGALLLSYREVGKITTNTLKLLGQLLMGRRGLEVVGGPMVMAKQSGLMLRQGWVEFLFFVAFVSVSVGLLNFFPIPVLDGGHLLLCILELIRGKPLGDKLSNIITRICFFLLMLLMAFVLIKDVIWIYK